MVRLARLSVREREVLTLLCDGCAREEIATQLVVSSQTVRSHVAGAQPRRPRVVQARGAQPRRSGRADRRPRSACGTPWRCPRDRDPADAPPLLAARHVHTGDRVHVLRGDDGSEHLVNETAQALWQLCDGDTTIEEMIEGVCVCWAPPAPRSPTTSNAPSINCGRPAWCAGPTRSPPAATPSMARRGGRRCDRRVAAPPWSGRWR